MPSPFDNIRIVLSHTSHAGNIGATARAMKTMGLASLYLVNPQSYPDNQAHVRAVSARDVLYQATVCGSLDDALQGTVLAAAMTSRTRALSHDIYAARSAAEILLEHARQQPVALVFGAETSGLTADEVSKCQLQVFIPANPDYPSLNLASAVQVMAYELYLASQQQNRSQPSLPSPPTLAGQPATLDEIEFFFRHLEQVMTQLEFLNPRQPKKLMQRLRRLFSRTRLEKEEANILRGILSAVEKKLAQSQTPKSL